MSILRKEYRFRASTTSRWEKAVVEVESVRQSDEDVESWEAHVRLVGFPHIEAKVLTIFGEDRDQAVALALDFFDRRISMASEKHSIEVDRKEDA